MTQAKHFLNLFITIHSQPRRPSQMSSRLFESCGLHCPQKDPYWRKTIQLHLLQQEIHVKRELTGPPPAAFNVQTVPVPYHDLWQEVLSERLAR